MSYLLLVVITWSSLIGASAAVGCAFYLGLILRSLKQK